MIMMGNRSTWLSYHGLRIYFYLFLYFTILTFMTHYEGIQGLLTTILLSPIFCLFIRYVNFIKLVVLISLGLTGAYFYYNYTSNQALTTIKPSINGPILTPLKIVNFIEAKVLEWPISRSKHSVYLFNMIYLPFISVPFDPQLILYPNYCCYDFLYNSGEFIIDFQHLYYLHMFKLNLPENNTKYWPKIFNFQGTQDGNNWIVINYSVQNSSKNSTIGYYHVTKESKKIRYLKIYFETDQEYISIGSILFFANN